MLPWVQLEEDFYNQEIDTCFVGYFYVKASNIVCERFAFFYENDTKQRFQEETCDKNYFQRRCSCLFRACSDMGFEFQSIAARLVKEQNRLKTFIDSEFAKVDPLLVK